jgi:hypothetical protein
LNNLKNTWINSDIYETTSRMPSTESAQQLYPYSLTSTLKKKNKYNKLNRW